MIQLGYFTIDTEDLDKARAFYAALFGWTFDKAQSHLTYAHVAGGQPSFGFVKVELGGRAAVPSDSESGRTAVVSDDQGVSFSLWQPAPGF